MGSICKALRAMPGTLSASELCLWRPWQLSTAQPTPSRKKAWSLVSPQRPAQVLACLSKCVGQMTEHQTVSCSFPEHFYRHPFPAPPVMWAWLCSSCKCPASPPIHRSVSSPCTVPLPALRPPASVASSHLLQCPAAAGASSGGPDLFPAAKILFSGHVAPLT